MPDIKSKQISLKQVKSFYKSSNSSIKKVELDYPLSIEAKYINNAADGIRETLNSLCGRYSQKLGGVIMEYENVKLHSDKGFSISTNPYLHVIIRATFFLFDPKIGDVLNGVVVKRTAKFVGCLVHGMFNVYIPLEGTEPIEISENESVEFTITEVDVKGYLPNIKGKLDHQ